MGRIANAFFNGFVSGAAQGLENHFVAHSQQDRKIQEVSQDRFSSDSPPILQLPDNIPRVPVGTREAPPKLNITPAPSPSPPPFMHSYPSPIIPAPSPSPPPFMHSRPFIPAPSPSPYPVDKEYLEQKAAFRNPSNSEETRSNNNSSSSPPSLDRKDNSEQKDAFVNHIPTDIREFPNIPSPVIPHLPSLDVMKNGIKNAFMDARKEAGSDGAKGNKAKLNEIAGSAKNQILLKSGLRHPDDVTIPYGYTADIAKRNLETFIHSVAPNVNARLTAEVILVKSGGAVSSTKCIEVGAKAALEDINQQNRGVRGTLQWTGDITYSTARTSYSDNLPEKSSFGRDNREEADPYSPMGPHSPTSPEATSPAFNKDNEIRQTELAQNSEISLERNTNFDPEGNNDPNSGPRLIDMGITALKTAYHGIAGAVDGVSGNLFSGGVHAFEFGKNVTELGYQVSETELGQQVIERGQQVIEKCIEKFGDTPDPAPPPGMSYCEGPIYPHFEYNKE